jgi:hypothetical protein
MLLNIRKGSQRPETKRKRGIKIPIKQNCAGLLLDWIHANPDRKFLLLAIECTEEKDAREIREKEFGAETNFAPPNVFVHQLSFPGSTRSLVANGRKCMSESIVTASGSHDFLFLTICIDEDCKHYPEISPEACAEETRSLIEGLRGMLGCKLIGYQIISTKILVTNKIRQNVLEGRIF